MSKVGSLWDKDTGHFDIVQKNVNGAQKDYSQCRHCVYQNPGKQHTTLKFHLSHKHPTVYKKFLEEEEERTHAAAAKELRDTASQKSLLQYLPGGGGGTTAVRKRKPPPYPRDHPKKVRLDSLVADLFSSCNVAYRLVKADEFRGLVEELDPQYILPRSPSTVSAWVGACLARMKNSLKAALRDKVLCVSADIWSQRGLSRSFMGINAHFYYKKINKVQAPMIGLRNFKHPHKSGDIRALIDKVLDEFDISPNNVQYIVTDAGSNMVAAYKNAVLMEYYMPEAVDTDERPVYEDPNLEMEADMDEDDLNLDYDVTSIDQETREIPGHQKCAAHRITKVAEHGCNSDEDYKVLEKKLLELLSKFRHSGAATEALKELSGLGLANVSRTRWLFFYVVAHRTYQLKEAIMNVAGRQKWTIEFSWAAVEAAVKLLKPLFNAVTKLEKTETCSGSLLLPMLFRIEMDMNAIIAGGILTTAARGVKTQITRYFKHNMDFSDVNWDPTYLMAAMINPAAAIRMGKLFDRGLVELKAYAQARYTDIEATMVGVLEEEPEADGEEGQPPPADAALGLFGDLPVRKKSKKGGPSTDKKQWEKDFNAYVAFLDALDANRNIDVAKFWLSEDAQFKELGRLVEPLVILPASSASTERSFSVAGAVMDWRRLRLSDTNLEAETLYKANKQFRR